MRRIVATIAIIALVIIAAAAAVVSWYFNSKLSKIKTTQISEKPAELGISVRKYTDKYVNSKYVNILLLGIDSRGPNAPDSPGLADTIMILTLDKAHNKIKITSLMRDMLIDNIQGEDATAGTTQDRINVIYKRGGFGQAGGQYSIKAINSNFDMNIKDYIKIDFTHFDKIVDAVGGVDINLSEDEVKVANGYISEVAGIENISPPYLTHSGMQHLNGIQALGYCRIRYVGRQDYERTERQRTVLTQVLNKLTNMNLSQAITMLDTILPNVETSLSKSEIISNGSYVILNKVKVIEQFRLPEDKPGYQNSVYINNVYFLGWNKEANDADLRKFIFENDADKIKQ
ncbi:MAG: LCP family protein [Bacillota bacterium]|nr:LCP family protein [Bacillota bacterium]